MGTSIFRLMDQYDNCEDFIPIHKPPAKEFASKESAVRLACFRRWGMLGMISASIFAFQFMTMDGITFRLRRMTMNG